MKEYDIVVLGAGPGGYVAAIKAAQMGAKTAIIEKDELGGVCLNWGCIPTKTLLKSAKVYEDIMNAERFGIKIADKSCVSIDWPKMQKRKENVVKKLTSGVKFLLRKNGVVIYNGYGEVIDKNTLKVNEETIKTKNLIIGTGSSPKLPNIEGIQDSVEKGYVHTSEGMLALEEIPKELIVIGGGVIGIEFATLYNTLGSKVTIIQRSDRILGNIDKDIRETMASLLVKSGIEIVYGVSIEKFQDNKIYTTVNDETRIFTGDKILVSMGREAN